MLISALCSSAYIDMYLFANDAYCCETNPTTENFKLFFPVFC